METSYTIFVQIKMNTWALMSNIKFTRN